MYAAVLYLSFDPDLLPAVESAFAIELLPRVMTSPGFKSGYWLESAESKSLGFLLFDSAAQAHSACAPALWQLPGITVDHVDVRRVTGTL